MPIQDITCECTKSRMLNSYRWDITRIDVYRAVLHAVLHELRIEPLVFTFHRRSRANIHFKRNCAQPIVISEGPRLQDVESTNGYSSTRVAAASVAAVAVNLHPVAFGRVVIN